ncbi:MAG: CHASE2 domain-containing protein [Caldimonas sp.]
MKQVQVFLSYRRDDSALTASVLYEALRDRPDIFSVFMDVDGISYGDDFVAVIDRELSRSQVVLVLIGPKWSDMLQARLRSDDWVRHEVATALGRRDPDRVEPTAAGHLRVLPILIDGASPPSAQALPAELAALPHVSMLTFDARTRQASVNAVLEAILGETFEQRARRLADEAERERKRLDDERQRLEEELGLRERERRRRFWTLMGSAAAGFTLFLANWVGLLDLLDIDTRVASTTMMLAGLAAPREAPWSGDVVLVGIDPDSEKALQRKFDPTWRAEHAALITHAASAAARVVAFDMVLEDPGADDANAALQRAVSATRDKMPVVFGVQTTAGDGEGVMLAQFAPLVRRGIACAGQRRALAHSMPLAVQRSAPAASASADPRARDDLTPSFALAAFSGGGRVELLDEGTQTATVRLRPQRKTQTVAYYAGETVDKAQPGCDIVAKGDRVVSQLIDPYTLPTLRSAPRRVAYEKVVAGDPATLALLKDRVVLVGLLMPGKDVFSLPWPAGERWGVELIAAQVDAMARDVAVRPIDPIAELLLTSAMGLLGAVTVYRLRERSRAVRIGLLVAIAVAFVVAAIAWYRSEQQLIGVPYELMALGVGAWLASRATTRRSTT